VFYVLLAVAYAQIDWHDFVVVETVDYQPFEMGNFPPPTTPDEVGARVLMQVCICGTLM
jgi:splicing factor 3A subunit 1